MDKPITAQELRIGNLVSYINTSDICKVIGISEYGLDVEFKEETTYIEHDQFEAIPLTEDILLKCGAILHGIDYVIKACALPIKIRFHSRIAYCEFGEFGNVYLGDRIKYLHQLQNLYFCLTGQELEVSI